MAVGGMRHMWTYMDPARKASPIGSERFVGERDRREF